jgi:DNA-binding NtrC family response regulator
LITTAHLTLTPPISAPTIARPAQPHVGTAEAAPASGDLHSMERAMIEEALKEARFNKSKAAKKLGLTRTQLYVRLRRHGLE